MFTAFQEEKYLEYYECLCRSDVDYYEMQNYYIIDFCFDSEQLPCALIIHRAKRAVNYLFCGLAYAYSFSGRKIYSFMNAYIGLMWVLRFENADFHAMPSLLF